MGAEQATRTEPLGAAIEIRSLRRLEEFARCVELQKLVWGFSELDVVPLPMFVVAAHTGGQVFGAYEADQMVGFLMAVPGIREGRLYLHSHMTAVLPAYQSAGVGRRLKLEQRREALARGIRLVEWTFDPLEIRNAYFNLQRLGAVVRRYLPNYYGLGQGRLQGQLPTDRLLAEWWLDSEHAEARLAGVRTAPPAQVERIRVSRQVTEWRHTDVPAAERVQREVREQFQHWLSKGYAAVGFEVDPATGDGVYLLAPSEGGV